MSTKNTLKILVVRPDRLGDVILSTPVLEVLKQYNPDSHITFMVRESVVPLLKGLPFVDDVMIFDPNERHSGLNHGLSGLFNLIHDLRTRVFRISVVLQSQWMIAAALFAAGVKYRVGPLSKPHSFLFFNRGLRQKRSYVEMHEVDYNLQLLRRLGMRIGTRKFIPKVFISDAVKNEAREWLTQKGIKQNSKTLILVHPGMGGSALNWPESHYAELILRLVKENFQVLVTFGPQEDLLMARIQDMLGTSKDKVVFYGCKDVGPIEKLGALMSFADLVVVPSTGPLHIATALGKPVVTFFSPIRVQSANRWSPYLADESKASILVPDVYCGQDFKCLGNLCHYYPCMRSLSVNYALEEIHKQLKRK
ncbi:MAG: glycosyltransferase family 9 protein [Bdellovibrio sp.]|nr:glycosyltransferase family 9 protein [Bdellovibrio sp.]